MTLRTIATIAASALAVATVGPPAHADFIFSPTGGSTGTVVQFESQFMNLTSFAGDTNKGASTVTFQQLAANGMSAGTELIGTDGKGQAAIVCNTNCNPFSTGGANGHQLTGLEIIMSAGLGAETFIGNLDFGEGTTSIVVEDQFGKAFTMILTKGSNFFEIDSKPGSGEVITDIKIFENAPSGPPDNTFGWNDLKQPRILACTIGVDCFIATPEPTSLALLGVGLLGLGLTTFRRRRA